jgi:hypothetical protein
MSKNRGAAFKLFCFHIGPRMAFSWAHKGRYEVIEWTPRTTWF